jgi:hypothetical protein
MVRLEPGPNGHSKSIAVANFTARIVRDIIVDDGAEGERRDFGVEAEVEGQRLTFTVAPAEFAGMGWVLKKLGPQAIIYPGQQQHARAAIQSLSRQIRQERVFVHLGWRKQGSQWVYLHAEGALGVDGPVDRFHVLLPVALQGCHLKSADSPVELKSAVRASLGFLSVAPDRISFPLLAAVYRAAFGKVNFSLFVVGPSGVFKTALAALCQQHFGAAMDASHLPANFSATGNALEGLAFSAKDALLVVDDFAPTGRHSDGVLQGVAERLFRAAGNHQGRSRMGGDGQLRAAQSPRALVLATGEEAPHGQSIRARLVIVAVGAGEVDRARLSECQRAGQSGQLAMSMGGFVSWIAGRHDAIEQRLQARVLELRNGSQGRAVHARLPVALAELQSGWEIFLDFAAEVGALDSSEKEELEERSRRAFRALAVLQGPYHQASDPALRFLSLLRAALVSGRAHVADPRGKAPEAAVVWGWQRKQSRRDWAPRGACIGWVGGKDLYLEPTASYQVAQQMAGSERLPVSEQSLRHRLREQGLLMSLDNGRQMLQIRRILEGRSRQVLHLKSSELVGRWQQ